MPKRKGVKMDKERELYDAFVDNLLAKVTEGIATPKELEIVMNFLKNNNIQATQNHRGLAALASEALDLPFDEDFENTVPLKRVK